MIVTGTINSPEGSCDRISVEGATYEEARAKLEGLLGEGQQLLVIRTDNY